MINIFKYEKCLRHRASRFNSKYNRLLYNKHDVQYNFYGNRIATAGSDGKIIIFEVSDDNNGSFKKLTELVKHEQSVWKICWSHPRFGNLLASCGFDKKVYIWKEESPNVWEIVYQYDDTKSVNTLSFCPQEYGLILLSGSSSGNITLHEYSSKYLILYENSEYMGI